MLARAVDDFGIMGGCLGFVELPELLHCAHAATVRLILQPRFVVHQNLRLVQQVDRIEYACACRRLLWRLGLQRTMALEE